MNHIVPINTSIPTEHEMIVYHTMAEQAVSSKMYTGIGDKSGVMMIMLAARELGIPPFQALNGGLNIIQGKVEISARMMNALIRKAGHSIVIKESTDTSCVLVGRRADNNDTFSTSYTFAEAQKAGLVKSSGGWAKCPKDMCFARALSRLARQLFSDVIGIGYVEGEIKPIENIQADNIPELNVEELPVDDIDDKISQVQKILNPTIDTDINIAIGKYINVVQDHFNWSLSETLDKLLSDQDTLATKFNSWMSKRKST